LRLAKTLYGKTYQQVVVHKVVVFRERSVENWSLVHRAEGEVPQKNPPDPPLNELSTAEGLDV
jgi:hypothetical protein